MTLLLLCTFALAGPVSGQQAGEDLGAAPGDQDLWGRVEARMVDAAARIGAVCASYAVECHGTQQHHFSAEIFRTRYEDNFGALPPTVSLTLQDS